MLSQIACATKMSFAKERREGDQFSKLLKRETLREGAIKKSLVHDIAPPGDADCLSYLEQRPAVRAIYSAALVEPFQVVKGSSCEC
jgi:hypothetical protein